MIKSKAIRYYLIIPILILAFFPMFTIELSDLREFLFFFAFSLVISWLYLCFSKKFWAFSMLFFLFILAYTRLAIPVFPVSGPGNRGSLAICDLMWFSLLSVTLIKKLFLIRRIKIRKSYPFSLWLLLPFVLFATLLPLIGIFTGNWPYSYAIPGLRTIQWMSLACISCYIAHHYGLKKTLSQIFQILLFVSIIHMFYASIQLGYYFGLLSRSWIVLDNLFSQLHSYSWFFYPRLTGLYTNPNSYGIYSAVVFLLSLAMFMERIHLDHIVLWSIGLISSLFGLLFAGSRSSYIGLISAFMIYIFLLAPKSKNYILRGTIFMLTILLSGLSTFLAFWPLFPEMLKGRLIRFFYLFLQGSQIDENAQARIEEWHRLWNYYISDSPYGTFVPPSYATDSPVDNFYIFTAIQGTPIFTAFWLLFLMGVLGLGWQALQKSREKLLRCNGLILIELSGCLAGASLTMSPMLEPQIIVTVWILIGLALTVLDLYSQKESIEPTYFHG